MIYEDDIDDLAQDCSNSMANALELKFCATPSIYTYTYISINSIDEYIERGMVHYDDVIMGTIASQITSLTIVYSIVYSAADQRKHQSCASLAFVNGQLRRKCFHLMTSSCWSNTYISTWMFTSWTLLFCTQYERLIFVKSTNSIQFLQCFNDNGAIHNISCFF